MIKVGELKLEVWHTPGHTDSQLSFRLGESAVQRRQHLSRRLRRRDRRPSRQRHSGVHPSRCERIRASDVEWLLPSHGPIFRKDNALLDQAIARLEGYLHMADFGTCAIDWPLMEQWDKELAEGRMPG